MATRVIKPFSSDQFTAYDSGFETAADKAKFANDLVNFVRFDFPQSRFSKKFYTRLSMCFGHIAHYDINGFYATWFSSTGKRLDWLCHIAKFKTYGDPAFTYTDVEAAFGTWLRASGIIDQYTTLYAGEVEDAERAELARLSAKYA